MLSLDDALKTAVRDAIREVIRDELPGIIREMAPAAEARPGTYLTAMGAAELAGVDRDTVYTWVRQGKLRAAHAGNRLRIKRSDLERFLAKEPETAVSEEQLEARVFQIMGAR